MDAWVLIALSPLLLLSLGLVPGTWARRHVQQMSRFSGTATLLVLFLALASGLMLMFTGRIEHTFVDFGSWSLGVYYDVLSALLLLLVAFLGSIVVRYSLNYLRGDAGQGYFLKWLCVTIGCVMTLLVASNLVMLTVAWIATSFRLNRLLTFYSDRPAALTAARKKFLISRLGDACLLLALVFTFRVFGSWEYRALFAGAQALSNSGAVLPAELTWTCLLFVGGTMLKSAQFPFHSWLPDTMETPTPVSALMHANIINAGGFLIVRLSPLVSLSPIAMDTLACVGAITAVFGSLVMMTQASVKRMLAFSTIAQMGFMMLQCGLGRTLSLYCTSWRTRCTRRSPSYPRVVWFLSPKPPGFRRASRLPVWVPASVL